MDDFHLLSLKLKRHKIGFQIRGNTVIIKGNKLDYSVLFIQIILPFLGLIAIFFSKGLLGMSFFEAFKLKGILFALFIAAYIFINSVRIYHKKVTNTNEKVFANESLIIKKGQLKKILFRSDIANFGYDISELDDDIYLGNLYIIDKEDYIYLLFGIEDESEKFIKNDIIWFLNFFIKYFNLDLKDLEVLEDCYQL